MTIENRFALVTVRVPLSEFTTEDAMNVWPPGDWPEVVAEESMAHLQSKGMTVVHSQMEGEVFRPSKFTYYVTASVMGSIIGQYREFENDPPSVKEIQAVTDDIASAVMKMYENAGQPLEEAPQDIVVFTIHKVSGKAEDAIPKDEIEVEGSADPGDDVEKQERPSGNISSRKQGGDLLH